MQEQAVRCARCGSIRSVKAGFVYGNQRYKCKDCAYHYTLNEKGVKAGIKRMAIHLYLEGMGYRAIGRIIGVSDVAIARWIRPMKEGLAPMRKEPAKLHELHKMEHFFITKELFNKYGWLLIGMEENQGVCLLGSYTVGNCSLIGK